MCTCALWRFRIGILTCTECKRFGQWSVRSTTPSPSHVLNVCFIIIHYTCIYLELRGGSQHFIKCHQWNYWVINFKMHKSWTVFYILYFLHAERHGEEDQPLKQTRSHKMLEKRGKKIYFFCFLTLSTLICCCSLEGFYAGLWRLVYLIFYLCIVRELPRHYFVL
jgi:hypothetical protein